MRLFKEHGRPLTRFHRNKNVSSGSETVTKLNPLITLSRKVGGGGDDGVRPAGRADKKAENVQRGRKASYERLFTFSQANAVSLKEENHSRGRARESQLQGAGRGREGGQPPAARPFTEVAAHRKVPAGSAAPFPVPSRPPHARRRSARAAHAAGVATSTQLGVGTPDVGRRGRRCWPAVTRRALSQSALGAGAGRPLNSARQLPAVWRVHSAMQYVCQRCGTKEQPFCDWAGPAPRCQGLSGLLSALSTEMPFISAPDNQKEERGGERGVLAFQLNSLYLPSPPNSRSVRIISVIKWLPPKKLTFTVHKQLQLAFLNSPGVLDSLLRSWLQCRWIFTTPRLIRINLVQRQTI